ncbi:MAG: SRPBCC family protein [Lacibacter sp.]
MSTLHLTTFIAAPVEVVFDLSRHIGLHKISQQNHKEEAVNGITSGLIKEGETVTWKAYHLYKFRFLKVKITAMQMPDFFKDVMISGDFKSYEHEHHFKKAVNGTIIIDIVRFELPYGILGSIVDRLYLRSYMKQLIEQRNKTIKEYAESNKWQALLNKRF